MRRTIKDFSNAELIYRFETACFRLTNYPNNKAISDEFKRVEAEICKRLGCTVQEVNNLEIKGG